MKKLISILFLLSISFGLSSCQINAGGGGGGGSPEIKYIQEKPTFCQKNNETYLSDKNGSCTDYKIKENSVYFGDKKIEKADSKTFQVVGKICYLECLSIENGVSGFYGKDKNFVYFNSKILEGADSKTFDFIPIKKFPGLLRVYLKDSENYFFEDKKIPKNATINRFLIDYFLEKNFSVFFEINKDKENNLYVVATYFFPYSCSGNHQNFVSPFWELGCYDGAGFFAPMEQPMVQNLEKQLQEKFGIKSLILSYKTEKGKKTIDVYKNGKYLVGHNLVLGLNKEKKLILISFYSSNIESKTLSLYDTKTGYLQSSIVCDNLSKECETKATELIKKFNLYDKFDKTLFTFGNQLAWQVELISRTKSKNEYCNILKHTKTNIETLLNCKTTKDEIGSEFKNVGFYFNKEVSGIFSINFIGSRDIDLFFVPQQKLDIALSRLYNSVGFDFYEKKKYQEAIGYFEKAIKTDGNYSQAIFNNACSYSILNQKEKSIENLKKLIEIDKTNFKEKILKDKDLENIRSSKEFQEILKKL